MKPFLNCFLLILCVTLLTHQGQAKDVYGVYLSQKAIHQATYQKWLKSPLINPQKPTLYIGIGKPQPKPPQQTLNFIICIVLLLFLGLFRQFCPVYFKNLFRVFGNTALRQRQLREQMKQDFFKGFVLDLLFLFSVAFFIYRATQYGGMNPQFFRYDDVTIIGGIGLLLATIYIIRFLILRLTGWLFEISNITTVYSFNIFLFNRVLGILLIPFSIIITFGQGGWVYVSLIIALLLIFLFFMLRFIRSRKIFEHFLRFSKFHFILYLCGSEIIPLIVLIKLVTLYIL